MTTLQLQLALAPFPVGQQLDANQYGQALVQNLSATLVGNILQGQTRGVAPTTDIGPWFDGTTWEFFDSQTGIYLPMTGPVSVSNLNRILNADTVVNRRLGVWSNLGSGTVFTLDRYRYVSTLNTGTASVSQGSLSWPATAWYPQGFNQIHIASVAAEPTVGATEYAILSQPVTKSRSQWLFGIPSSFAIVMQSNITGTFYAAIRNSGYSTSYLIPCTITQVGMPTRVYEANIPAPAALGSWGTVPTDYSFEVAIVLAAGANFNIGTPHIWNGANYLCGPTQTNFFSASGNTLDISFIQYQPGPTPTPFPGRDFFVNMAECQAYYFNTYPLGIAPGSANALGGAPSFIADSGNTARGYLRFPSRMRTNPSPSSQMAFWSPVTGAAGQVRNNNTTADMTLVAAGVTASETSLSSVQTVQTIPATGYPGSVGFHVAVDTEIYN